MSEENNVISISGKTPSKDRRVLKRAILPRGNRICRHGPFLVDDRLSTVECEGCGEKLNPMFVLLRLAGQETEWHTYEKKYNEDMARLAKRQRTKCEHCKEMTRVSH